MQSMHSLDAALPQDQGLRASDLGFPPHSSNADKSGPLSLLDVHITGPLGLGVSHQLEGRVGGRVGPPGTLPPPMC